MRQSWKKLSALLLIAALLLCGCVGGDTGDGPNGEVETAPRTEDGKIELVFWMTYSDGSYDGLNELVNQFNAASDKYVLRMEYGGTAENVRQKLRFLDRKDYPSLFSCAPNAICEFATAQHIVPLQEYLDKDSDKWADDIFDVVKKSYCDTEGNMIGGCLGVSVKGWMVNVDMLEDAGYTLNDITSFEKVAEISQAAHDKKLCTYGYAPYYGYDVLEILGYQGLDVLDNDNGYGGTPNKCLFNEGETGAAMSKLLNMYADLSKGGALYYSGSGTADSSLFVNKQTLFWGCTNSFVYTLQDMNLGFEWAFIPVTGVDDNAEYKNCALAEGTGLFICDTGDEEEMQGAYEVIKFFAEPLSQLSWCTYRGYVPYTNAAVQKEEWTTWRDENFPSAEKLITSMMAAPEELRIPYSQVTVALVETCAQLVSNIYSDPDGDVAQYIKEATDKINDSIELINLRGQ